MVCTESFVGTRARSSILDTRLPPCRGIPDSSASRWESTSASSSATPGAPCPASWVGFRLDSVLGFFFPSLRRAGKGKLWAVRVSLTSPSAACSAPVAAERGRRAGETPQCPCAPGAAFPTKPVPSPGLASELRLSAGLARGKARHGKMLCFFVFPPLKKVRRC